MTYLEQCYLKSTYNAADSDETQRIIAMLLHQGDISTLKITEHFSSTLPFQNFIALCQALTQPSCKSTREVTARTTFKRLYQFDITQRLDRMQSKFLGNTHRVSYFVSRPAASIDTKRAFEDLAHYSIHVYFICNDQLVLLKLSYQVVHLDKIAVKWKFNYTVQAYASTKEILEVCADKNSLFSVERHLNGQQPLLSVEIDLIFTERSTSKESVERLLVTTAYLTASRSMHLEVLGYNTDQYYIAELPVLQNLAALNVNELKCTDALRVLREGHRGAGATPKLLMVQEGQKILNVSQMANAVAYICSDRPKKASKRRILAFDLAINPILNRVIDLSIKIGICSQESILRFVEGLRINIEYPEGEEPSIQLNLLAESAGSSYSYRFVPLKYREIPENRVAYASIMRILQQTKIMTVLALLDPKLNLAHYFLMAQPVNVCTHRRESASSNSNPIAIDCLDVLMQKQSLSELPDSFVGLIARGTTQFREQLSEQYKERQELELAEAASRKEISREQPILTTYMSEFMECSARVRSAIEREAGMSYKKMARVFLHELSIITHNEQFTAALQADALERQEYKERQQIEQMYWFQRGLWNEYERVARFGRQKYSAELQALRAQFIIGKKLLQTLALESQEKAAIASEESEDFSQLAMLQKQELSAVPGKQIFNQIRRSLRFLAKPNPTTDSFTVNFEDFMGHSICRMGCIYRWFCC